MNRTVIRADRARVTNVGGPMEPGDQEMVLEAVEDCEIVDNEVGRGGFRVRDASRNLLEDNTKRGHGYGVRLENADRNRLRTNTFVGEATITLRNADRNELVGNATDTEDVNVRVLSSTQNRIAGNRIEGGPGTTGVYLGGSDRNVILGNDVRGNLSGLVADAADLNVVYGNRFVGGDAWGTGLSLSTAAHNSVVRNRLDEYHVGLSLETARENHLVGNRICNANVPTQVDSESTANTLVRNETECLDDTDG
ncbi:MAG: NosD domain-containing protein [Haloarculaceae archaeon]